MGWRVGGAVLAGMLIAAAATGPTDARAADQARIAFNSDGRIIAIDADGSNRRQLSGPGLPGDRGAFAGTPAYSPGGRSIAFAREAEVKGEEVSQLYVMDADGGSQRPLTQARRNTYDGEPQWSPDGRSIVFSRFIEKRRRLISSIVVAAVGGGAERVVYRNRIRRVLRFLSEPTWSPDGRQIAFTETTLDREYYFKPALFVVPAQGGEPRLLVPDASGADWSPDGSRVAFVSVRDRNGYDCGSDQCSFNGEIYVAQPNGTGLARLTDNEGNDQAPDWSADGKRIAFSSDRNDPGSYDGHELYSIEPDGNCLTWLTNGSPGSVTPSWEPSRTADTAPGGCGAVPRPPLVEHGAGPALGVKRHQVMWLGKRYGTQLLSDVYVAKSGTQFDYGDCAEFDPQECDTPVLVNSSWVCHPYSINALLGTAIYADLFLTHRGALASYEWFDGGLTGYAGQAEITVDLGGSDEWSFEQGLGIHQRAFDELYDVREAAPSGDLARATLPTQAMRRMRELVALRKRLGSYAAVKRKRHIDPYFVRNAVALDKALDAYGPVDKVRCPRRVRHALTLRSKRSQAARAATASSAAPPGSGLPQPAVRALHRLAQR